MTAADPHRTSVPGESEAAPTVDRARRAAPASQATTPARGDRETGMERTADSGPTVLVIEDDAAIRKMVRRMLEGAGYVVVEATSGRSALAQLHEGMDAQFLVTDLKMEDGSGGWLLAQLAYEHPELLPRTVIISGDAGGAGAAHIAVRWRCPVLAKPFTAEGLVRTLARIAEGERGVPTPD